MATATAASDRRDDVRRDSRTPAAGPPRDRPDRHAGARGRGLTRAGAFQNVSFNLYRGEILGIAGLLGAGRTELMRAIFGADPADPGTIALDGRRVSPAVRRR